MTDEELTALRQWSDTDWSDYAARIRAALAPTMREIVRAVQELNEALYPWRVPIMRRKLRRYARSL